MTSYHLTIKSSNAKTGPIPVSTTSNDTCPDVCSLKASHACYAESSHLGIHWRQVSAGSRGTDLQTFVDSIAALPAGQLWRHNQAGDLPGDNNKIDAAALGKLIRANRGRRGFTYTHKPMSTRENRALVRGANKHGFTINLSADTLQDADTLKSYKCGPVVCILPSDAKENTFTPAGNKVVVCPATKRDNVTCATCKLCAWADRDVIIGFPAHGVKKNLINITLLRQAYVEKKIEKNS
jgi:hypothetical protein